MFDLDNSVGTRGGLSLRLESFCLEVLKETFSFLYWS
jgi:hypothetical protein